MKLDLFYNCDAGGKHDLPHACVYCGDAVFPTDQICAVTNGTIVNLAHYECHVANIEDDFECPIGKEGCTQNCGAYGCGN